MQVAKRSEIYGPFFTDKTPENAKYVENKKNLTWCFDFVIKGHEKNIGAILKMARNHVLSDGAFWPTRTLFVEYCIFLYIREMTSTFTNRWAYAHGRHPYQV
jgi:hypothetical protein